MTHVKDSLAISEQLRKVAMGRSNMKQIVIILFMAPVDAYLWILSHLAGVRISVTIED